MFDLLQEEPASSTTLAVAPATGERRVVDLRHREPTKALIFPVGNPLLGEPLGNMWENVSLVPQMQVIKLYISVVLSDKFLTDLFYRFIATA